MRWDSSRPVPWQRLMREWVIYAGIMTAILLVAFRSNGAAGLIAGVLVSGPIYLAFGFVLAKFGYQRKTMQDLRAEREQRAAARSQDRSSDRSSDRSPASPPSDRRSRPAPTRRTSQGVNRPKRPKRR